MDADGDAQASVTGASVSGRDESPAWSPDGERIAFTRGFGLGQWIATVRPDGSDLEDLVAWSGAIDHLEPAWSPGGTLIAFEARDRATGARRVELASALTGDPVVPVASLPPGSGSPAWLDDTWIALAAEPHPGLSVRSVALVRVTTGHRVYVHAPQLGELARPERLPR